MPLSDIDYAYNELIDVINARDEQLDKLVEERDRAWRAAQLLYELPGHPMRRLIVETKK